MVDLLTPEELSLLLLPLVSEPDEAEELEDEPPLVSVAVTVITSPSEFVVVESDNGGGDVELV